MLSAKVMGMPRWKYTALFCIPLVTYLVGRHFDQLETLRMSDFRGKSKLYGRELAPGEKPPWP